MSYELLKATFPKEVSTIRHSKGRMILALVGVQAYGAFPDILGEIFHPSRLGEFQGDVYHLCARTVHPTSPLIIIESTHVNLMSF